MNNESKSGATIEPVRAKPNEGPRNDGSHVEHPAPPASRKGRSIAVFVAVVAIGAVLVAAYVIKNRGIEETDDAFIGADVYQITPKIAGRLASVGVSDNQSVSKGDRIAEIEPADFQSRVDRATAALELARAALREAELEVGIVDATTTAAVAKANADVASAQATLDEQRAQVETAKAENERAAAEFERYSKLSDRAVSPARLDVVRAAANSARSSLAAVEQRAASGEAELTAARARVAAAEAERGRVESARAVVERRKAEVAQAQAELSTAELELSYTHIDATASGRVTNKMVEPGDYLQAGRVIGSIVAPEVWVVANFKETQLEHMRPGQPVKIHVDAYGVDLDGHLESIQSGSGAHFSLLPPQNATGNYVKVVQRVPVKIVFDRPAELKNFQLGPGMSVVPRVDTR